MSARIAAAVLLTGILLFDAGRARACSLAGNAPHVVDPASMDTVPSEPPSDVSVQVNRGTHLDDGGCGSTGSTSCDGFANIQLMLNQPATDDQTSAENMGYLVEVIDGSPPGGLTVPADAVRAVNGTNLAFGWFDDDTDGQEIVAFSVRLTPVDEAGNVGPSSAPIRIYDPGSTEACATRNPAPSLDAALLLLLATGIGRALRRARPKAS